MIYSDSESTACTEEITVEQLQDLLIYDDTFLDFFNLFLRLPVFPQPLQYQRLTDTFQIIDEGSDSVLSGDSPPPLMLTENEHAKVINWAQKYRLPLFLKTDLFRELKLSKQLLRPLEEFYRPSAKSIIRGYSKQSNNLSLTTPSPTKSSKELSTNSNGTSMTRRTETSSENYPKEKSEMENDENIPYDSYLRPGSEAFSLPMQIETEKTQKDNSILRMSKQSTKLTRDISNLSQDDTKRNRNKSFALDLIDEDAMFYRIQSAPQNYDFGDFDFVYTNKVLYAKQRALNFGSYIDETEEQTEITDELHALESRQKISLQRLKEMIIGTSDGMREFRKFLKNTAGKSLCDFWLECEQLKDSDLFIVDGENIKLINNILRNLQDKYKMSLTKSAKDQIAEAMRQPERLFFLFAQTQYDALRRLRSYWLPRYLIHQEQLISQFSFSDLFYFRLPTAQSDTFSIQTGVFPKLQLERIISHSFGRSELHSMDWTEIFPDVKSVLTEQPSKRIFYKETSSFSDPIVKRSAFQNRLRLSLAIDVASGNPFKQYLQSLNEFLQIHNLDFYNEVQKFKYLTNRNSNKVLRISHAWSIVNRFLSSSSNEYIHLDDRECKSIISSVQKFKSCLPNEIFDSAVEFSVKKLEQEWLRFLKEDLKTFLESSLTPRDSQTPPHSIEDIDVTIEGESIVLRKRIVTKTLPLRAKTWDQLTKQEKQKRRVAALELRRITELERKKVLKLVQKRMKDQQEAERRLKNQSFMKFQQKQPSLKPEVEEEVEDDTGEETTMSEEQVELKVDEKVPEVKSVLDNKVLLNLLKKYVTDKVDDIGRDAMYSVTLLQEISSYMSIEGNDKGAISKKDHKANGIYKTYLDKSAKKLVTLSEKLKTKLSNDNERPKTPTFKEIQNYIHFKLSDVFKDFWKFETAELGIKSSVLAKMTEKELELIAENQLSEINRGGVNKAAATAVHTKEDKIEFMLALNDASYRPLTLQMLYFLKYIIEHGSAEKMQNLEKDLFFYIEVLKLKEMCKTTVDEDIAKKKMQCISSAFLESVHPPSVQINISNDVAQRIIRAVQRQLLSKDVNITVFDEAHYSCLKTLLPYWAGFQRQWEEPLDPSFRPISKYRRMLERRLELYNDIPIPKAEIITLPVIPKGTNLSTLSYSMNDGAKWKSTETGRESNIIRPDGNALDNSRKTSLPSHVGKKISRATSRLAIVQNT